MSGGPAGRGADPLFWIAVAFSALMLMGLEWRLRKDREDLVRVQHLHQRVSEDLASLEAVALSPAETRRELENFSAQLLQLDAILPEHSGLARRALHDMLEQRGSPVLLLEEVGERPFHGSARWVEYRLALGPAATSWPRVLRRMTPLLLVVAVDRVLVEDPRDPRAVLELELRVLVRR